ncbi:branched-chain alpha-keto acid dehydrogenase subunit e2 : Catalytic domain-containing protein of components of various dehydrogenase complexes OS=Isosphaera pallida (strain ATCC 43644 / DSM 9630 / IS1B) GN=Isop_0416 PE=3 SV=1: Biotin_lipoyl: E3_binding: 2-oxoacid_dh [Gemmataceae bacterium]|nr:branched-chain alpha-keto acid dehydrogenase subunit e2 : Catalytic domain-containing protein of components of various dehydrogenase complexes OS=Isosphaera pallida (strain ATCC 43644 / DSM 9630 / IS1B) GN=Isop_0416 PE=3 SV=1: Biotin_lipoyl: E3_binding: 2-oxoacid_dh [Gemmataceae bacterium]VTT99690.1 branched-chain alpha-keto acid dehydrogenase subunit e2 : Catalytic domain-containing protein of components of various dehydrogenase complexes OS=Isosphaera pallida (strain ATCC 43644 / DSM 9630 / I
MDYPLPPVGEGLFEVELVRWLVRPGDAVAPGQGLAEVMSDKASMEVHARFSGTITALAAVPGTKVKVGQVVLSYEPVGELVETGAAAARPATARPPVVTAASASPGGDGAAARTDTPRTNGHGHPAPAKLPPAAPSVRLLARKLGLDLARVTGTGPGGRILVEDLAPLIKPRPGAADRPPASKTDTSKLDFGIAGTRQKMVGMRRKIAEHLVDSKRRIPHYSYIDECDLTDLVRLRNQLREPLNASGVKLTYLAFFVKAVARSLKEVPIVNSTYDEAAGEVVLHDRYNVGIAVAAPAGLLVPVIKGADKKDVVAIAAEIDRLSRDAKAGKSKLEDLRGGTFTVTSVGGIGGLISTPIINHPEVGIMGVGRVVKRPVYDAHGDLRPADILFLSFSFDHRVVDGAVGAAFGNAVLRYLQAPALLLLPEKIGD